MGILESALRKPWGLHGDYDAEREGMVWLKDPVQIK
jgi:hypothetical protein